jgi:hypothetical protein
MECGNSHKLHPHLLEDLRSLRHDESSVQFFVGFEDLLARALSPRQRLFPELEAQVKNGRLGQHELIPWLASILPSIAIRFHTGRLRRKDWVIGEIHSIDRPSLSSTSRLTDRTILVILLFMFSADVVPKQSELLLEEVSEIRIAEFLAFVAVELELETNAVVSVEVNQVIPLDEW